MFIADLQSMYVHSQISFMNNNSLCAVAWMEN